MYTQYVGTLFQGKAVSLAGGGQSLFRRDSQRFVQHALAGNPHQDLPRTSSVRAFQTAHPAQQFPVLLHTLVESEARVQHPVAQPCRFGLEGEILEIAFHAGRHTSRVIQLVSGLPVTVHGDIAQPCPGHRLQHLRIPCACAYIIDNQILRLDDGGCLQGDLRPIGIYGYAYIWKAFRNQGQHAFEAAPLFLCADCRRARSSRTGADIYDVGAFFEHTRHVRLDLLQHRPAFSVQMAAGCVI